LDWLIPVSEAHVRKVPKSWIDHYNHGRPHMALGPGCSGPASESGRSIVEVTAST
jgi:hypothetical protein